MSYQAQRAIRMRSSRWMRMDDSYSRAERDQQHTENPENPVSENPRRLGV